MAQVGFVNKENLRIARENIGLMTRFVSDKISKSQEDIILQFESGDKLPTWAQIRQLAKLYNISEILFFSKNTISKYKEIPDYRVGADSSEDEKVKKLINLVISRQKWLENKLKEDGFKQNNLQGSGKNLSSPNELAKFIYEKLEISIEEIKKFSGMDGSKKTLKYLIQKAEDKGIFVGKTIHYHNIKVKNLRGVFISNPFCPFIILNRKDALAGQIFSFIHELSHLFRKSEAISNSLNFRNQDNPANNEEVFCNRVAVEFLLPKEELQQNIYSEADLENICSTYKVSKLTTFYRLKEMRKLGHADLDSLEEKIKAETERNLILKAEADKKKEGGNYTNSMRDSNGSLFNNYVVRLYSDNEIGPVEASNLLRFSPENA